MNVVTYEPEYTRPDLPVPLSPTRGLPKLVRRYLLGLHGPSFASAYRITVAWAAAGCAVAVVSLLLPSPWQQAVVACSALLGLYVVVRALALVAFERRQHVFESEWMAAQSEVLRGHAFDVLRFTVQDLSGSTGVRRVYDLTRPADVRDLRHRQDHERASRQFSRATVEFTYVAGGGTLVVADVRRELPEVIFLEGWAGPGRAQVRFPQARYLGRPGPGRRPAQRTSWTLSGPVMIAVGESVYSCAAGPTEGSAAAGTAEASGLGSAR